MHDLIFKSQSEWAGMEVEQFQDWLVERAGEMDLDIDQFSNDMLSSENEEFVRGTWDRGVEIGIPGTPFLLIDGSVWPQNLPITIENFRSIIELKLLEGRQFTSCPPMTINPRSLAVSTTL